MKISITAILSVMTTVGMTQSILVPGENSFEKKWIEERAYTMGWYSIKDTLRSQIGEVATHILTDKNYITVVTEVKMKHINEPWIDTTIASISSLAPIRHASYNRQRDMVLNFGKIVTGYYRNNVTKQHYMVSDTTSTAFFDSNIYPALITWLPLMEGYKQDLSIYDYHPLGKNGILKASIKNVSSGIYESMKSGSRNVWIVTVTDEIGNGEADFMTFYIDKKDRKLWKQEINAGGRRMLMLLTEQK